MFPGWQVGGLFAGSFLDPGTREHHGRETSRDAVTGLWAWLGRLSISLQTESEWRISSVPQLRSRPPRLLLRLPKSTEHNPFRWRRLLIPVRLAGVGRRRPSLVGIGRRAAVGTRG